MSLTATPIINAFTAGELSPHLDGRTDHEKYYSGCRRLENFVVRPHGSAYARPGLRYLGKVKDRSRKTRLLPFDFNAEAEESAIIELGHNYLRIWQEGGQGYRDGKFQEDELPEQSTPWSEDMLAEVRCVQSADTLYLVHKKTPPHTLVRSLDAHKNVVWTLAPFQAKDGPYQPENPESGVVLTPSSRTGTNVTVTANIEAFDPDHQNAHLRLGYEDEDGEMEWGWGKITEVGSKTSATVSVDPKQPFGAELMEDATFEFGIGGWSNKSTYECSATYDSGNRRLVLSQASSGTAIAEAKINLTPNVTYTLTLEAAAVPRTARAYVGTSSGASDALADQVITAAGVASFEFTPSKSPVYVAVSTYGANAGDVVSFDAVRLARKDLATTRWRMGAWCEENGYPSCVALYENRLTFAGSKAQPRTVWFSRFGDYPNFGPGPLADDAIEHDLSGDRVNIIRWMVDQDDLLIGTNAAEIRLDGGGEGEPLSAEKKPKARRQSPHGSCGLAARLVGGAVLFVSRSGRKVRELAFDLGSYKYHAPEITILADHVTGDGLADLAFCGEPGGVLWAARADGMLIGCTYLKDQNVTAWHRHPLGGNGAVESLAAIPGTGGDELWAVVRRTMQGEVKRYVERMAPAYDGAGHEDAAEAFHLDCGKTHRGAPVTEVGDLAHLEGETVQVVADGAVKRPRQVQNGMITLEAPASQVHVGYAYPCVLQPMRLEVPAQGGTSQGRRKRILSVTARFMHTVGGSVCAGDDETDRYEPVLPHARNAPAGAAPRLFSGDRILRLAGGVDREGLFTIRQDAPLPMTVVSVVPEVQVE
ncbi:MAG: hypothetical protein AB1916_15440 [Thermodesulfobacteriota bacterium]